MQEIDKDEEEDEYLTKKKESSNRKGITFQEEYMKKRWKRFKKMVQERREFLPPNCLL